MDAVFPPDPSGVAGALATLRHALADPLSAAGLKLELLERHLAAVPFGGTLLTDRVRGAKADIETASRLLDLLLRLSFIAGETAGEISIPGLCRAAGVALEEGTSAGPLLRLRPETIRALASVAEFLRSKDPGDSPPRSRVEENAGRVSLRMDVPGTFGALDPARLFQLPHGEEQRADLFLARAAVEADGGRLQFLEREGHVTALFSWPLPESAKQAGPS